MHSAVSDQSYKDHYFHPSSEALEWLDTGIGSRILHRLPYTHVYYCHHPKDRWQVISWAKHGQHLFLEAILVFKHGCHLLPWTLPGLLWALCILGNVGNFFRHWTSKHFSASKCLQGSGPEKSMVCGDQEQVPLCWDRCGSGCASIAGPWLAADLQVSAGSFIHANHPGAPFIQNKWRRL